MAQSVGDDFKRRDRLFPRYRWSTSRGGTWLGLLGLVVTTLIVLALGPGPFAHLADHPFTTLVLLVLAVWAGRQAVEVRGGRLSFRLTFDAGLLVLALALLGPLAGTAFWLVATFAAEATRDYVAIGLGNLGMVAVSGAAAADVLAMLGSDPFSRSPLSAAAVGALTAAAYVLVQVALTELGTWILTGGKIVRMTVAPTAAALIVGTALGAVSGAFVHLYGASHGTFLLALPTALVLALAHEIGGQKSARTGHAQLVGALTRLASADHLDEIERVVLEVAPVLCQTCESQVTTDPPRRGGRSTWFALTPHEATGPDGRPLEQRWLRAGLRDFELELPRHEAVPLEALAAGARAATERLLERDRIRFAADHDQLTGLLNRNGLWHTVLGCPGSGEGASYLLVDLDGFKAVNDTHGHAYGDEVLQIVAGALVAIAPEDANVARWGGDEFVVHLPRALDCEDLEDLGAEIIRVVTRSASELTGGCMTASVGYVSSETGPEQGAEGVDGLELLHRADQSMYAAKRAGKGTVRGLSA